jgi:hypothetical protein
MLLPRLQETTRRSSDRPTLLALTLALAVAASACGSRTGLIESESEAPPVGDAGAEGSETPEAGALDGGAPDAAPPLLDWQVGFDSVCMLLPGGRAGCFRFPNEPTKTAYDVSLEFIDGVEGATHMAGHEGFCALLSDATVTCWRRLAPGPRLLDAPARPVPGLDQVIQLDVADYGPGGNGCAVRTDGSVWCWGSDMYNELGRGPHCPDTNPDCDNRTHGPSPVVDLSGAVEVVVSDEQACVRTAAADVFCWGRVNVPSALAPDYSSPIPISAAHGATALAVSEGETVATLPNAFVYFGQPLMGEGPVAFHPVQEPRNGGERIYGSQYNTFCTKAPGARVHCRGGIGLKTITTAVADYDVPGTEAAVDVNVSTFTACAHMSENDLICWGQYTAGVTHITVRP